MDAVKIGLLGFGTVGRGVYRVLENHRRKIIKSCGADIHMEKVLTR